MRFTKRTGFFVMLLMIAGDATVNLSGEGMSQPTTSAHGIRDHESGSSAMRDNTATQSGPISRFDTGAATDSRTDADGFLN
jgi:hypothetical protein